MKTSGLPEEVEKYVNLLFEREEVQYLIETNPIDPDILHDAFCEKTMGHFFRDEKIIMTDVEFEVCVKESIIKTQLQYLEKEGHIMKVSTPDQDEKWIVTEKGKEFMRKLENDEFDFYS